MTTPITRLATALEGRYRVERELGQGGMAMVYLAHDMRHDRNVALKVLRPELSAVIGAERFLAEIKTTASLQHPHILPLHDSGEADGTVFYVMPLVEGESLRDRLTREKQLPVDDAVRIAREVASALDYAHRHGIVHRDIKPENILLHDGQAVVADFGIALAFSKSEGGSRMTETGMSLGTPHYMSPEQAMGEREITPKADIYAVGCVLYEMLTGDPPFTGSTAQAIVARTLTESPRSITLQRRTVPPHVEAAVLRAIEKLPADRFATAGEFAAALDNPGFARQATGTTPGVQRAADWRTRAVAPLGVLALALAGGLAWSLTRTAPERPVNRYALGFPGDKVPLGDRAVSISADGGYIAYVVPASTAAGARVETQVMIKPRDTEKGVAVAGTAGVTRTAFSSSGTWIAFATQDGQVHKASTKGGTAMVVGDSASPTRGVTWLDEASIVTVGRSTRQLVRFSADGGKREVLLADSAVLANPVALPDGRGVLFARCGAGGCGAQREVWVFDLHTMNAHRLIDNALVAHYVPTGHLVYGRTDGTVMAVGFDLHSLQVSGNPVPVQDSVSIGLGTMPLFAVSMSGTFVARVGANIAANPLYQMVWVDRSGRVTPVDSAWTVHLTNYAGNTGWRLSPDGTRLAIGLNTEAGDNVWVRQLPHGPSMRITFDSAPNHRPRWSPDGRSLMFVAVRAGISTLRTRPADGTGREATLLAFGARNVVEGEWTPDTRLLVFRSGGTQSVVGDRRIYVKRLGTDSAPTPLKLASGFDEAAHALSPNGKWLAYESNETGTVQVYVRPFPNTNDGKWQVSNDGGHGPVWAPNGRELFFINARRDMIAVPVAPTTTLNTSPPRVLFHLPDDIEDGENYTPHDISADGQRFIMARQLRSDPAQIAPLVVTENWFTELRRRLASK